ncbi:mevalonate kinase [[Candida] jaroonii]|uniref:Mevalonate kinase n=1 Tax=[Candida] jaroonii TaxID=467808 RepID=A0ACA9Y055_9ASCO|nr:mevalonate kinase [[Candida] jaroonii]
MAETFFVSAPGKVILFGEHSAVFGKPAIAAAISLRAYLLVSPSKDPNVIRLDFPDIKLSVSWNKSDIPFDEIKKHCNYDTEGNLQTTEELVPEIIELLTDSLANLNTTFHHSACLSFLYLYTQLCNKDTPGNVFCVRSTVPIGAGLGSSASTSVCLAAALGYLGGHISKPTFELDDKVNNSDVKELNFVDAWSFMGEKTFHGNPSGIDNAVSTHGGAVMYQRMTQPSNPSVRTTMRNFPPLKLLLTNSKIPRSTATLVGNVSKLNNEYPNIVGPILDAMGNISKNAYQHMIKPALDDESRKQLYDLVTLNHGLLVSLGVSHPVLEEIKSIGDLNKIGVTKLTGAGGGGCAITLVYEDVDEEIIKSTLKTYESKGFASYETSLGGKGVGALFSHSEESVFDIETFANLKTREEIESLLHINEIKEWKFW